MAVIRTILGLPFYCIGCLLTLPGMGLVLLSEKIKGSKYPFMKTMTKEEENK